MVGMRIKRSVGEKGQVVIPKDIREHLGLKPGSEIVFEVRDKEVVIKPSVDPIKFVEEFCNVPKKLKKINIKKLKKILEEEYEIR
jgi:AbrB family looped-hinge helix DNA binding protein